MSAHAIRIEVEEVQGAAFEPDSLVAECARALHSASIPLRAIRYEGAVVDVAHIGVNSADSTSTKAG